MTMAAIMKILMDLLAAAPSIESTVEEGVAALHSSSETGPQKVQAVVGAVQQLAGGVGQAVEAIAQPGTTAA